MSLQLPKTIFFDMDDTILADSLMSEKCWEQVCERFSPRFGNISSDSLLATIRDIRRRNYGNRAQSQRGGPNLRNSRYEVVSVALSSLGLDDRQLAEEMTAEYMRLKSKLIEPFPNALDTLHKLSQSPVRLALITNGIAEEQRSKIEIAGLSPFFESILIEGEFGIGKPDQRVFQHMLAEMNVKPQETWMVGDNLVGDIGGAQAAGIFGVWVDWQGSGLPGTSEILPDLTIPSIAELVQ